MFSHFAEARIFLGPGDRNETTRDGWPPGGHRVSTSLEHSTKKLYASAKWGIPVALDGGGFVATYRSKPNINRIACQRQLYRWPTTYGGTDSMKEWITVLRAADTAARWHVHQRRKGIAQEPYINHLLEVASLVAEATSGSDPTVVIAALLHDAVEDQEVSVEMIAREFGKPVADIVMEVTDDKTLPKDERKRKQVDNAGKKSHKAKLIKLADKTSNLRAIATSPAADWSIERRLEYIEWAKSVVAGLRGTSPWLEQQSDEAVVAAEGSLRRRWRGFRKSDGHVRYWMNSGKHILISSFSAFDPSQTSATPSGPGIGAGLSPYQSTP